MILMNVDFCPEESMRLVSRKNKIGIADAGDRSAKFSLRVCQD